MPPMQCGGDILKQDDDIGGSQPPIPNTYDLEVENSKNASLKASLRGLATILIYSSQPRSTRRLANVRFTPQSAHSGGCWACPLCATSRHSGRFWVLLLVGKGAQVRGASPVKL